MVKVAVSGVCGRMGALIARLVLESEHTELAGALERPGHLALGNDAGMAAGGERTGVSIEESLGSDVDVMIDFSSPEGSLARLAECETGGTAIVVGTTGLGEDFARRAKAASEKIACLIAPNMSVGMNVLFGTVGRVAKSLGGDYNVEIVEVHHRMKKDAPSGSALKLAESIQNEIGEMDLVHGREGAVGERGNREIGIHAVRAGDVVGKHTVIYAGSGESVEITHTAQSRETFAAGAVRAAVFAAEAPPGLYTMADVLGLNP